MGYAMDVYKDSWRTFRRIYVFVDAIRGMEPEQKFILANIISRVSRFEYLLYKGDIRCLICFNLDVI